ncbi:type II secretion system F family protein [Aeromicrobium piscarium]|uniref:Type II secretion system F family protein n=1 Tax=Aeromicrobium piscarium TaxID=2590901 RepID=A0A554SCZ6_9ACTN|nr:type II secretion system F family protein [Aeromicrobium piscarium]TSD64218.1 type II secretion system F family protein [Aeromicrobium piscarium]
MIAAICAALAMWCGIPARPRHRTRVRQGRRVSRLHPEHLAWAICPLLGLVVAGLLGAVVGAIAAPLAARWIARLEPAARRRERLRVAEQLPLAVELLVAAMDAGVPLRRALESVAAAVSDPLRGQLIAVTRRLAVAGEDTAVWAEHLQGPLAPLARSLIRAERHGVPAGSVLQDSARELRRERYAERRDAARRVAVRTAAPLGACFLPAFFLVGIVPMLAGALSSISWW